MTTASEFRAQWEQFKAFVRPGDILRGRVWRRSASWWLVDIGSPFLANLDDIDIEPGSELAEGDLVDVVVKLHQENKMMPFVTSRARDLALAGRHVELPDEMRGEIIWPPPIKECGE